MRRSSRRVRSAGLTLIQVMAVMGIIAILMSLVTSVAVSARRAARVIQAENNLRQVGTGMELYFGKYRAYPPQGSNLVDALKPFVKDPEVFNNPLFEETTPGQTLNEMYQQPTVEQVDSPGNYITAFYGDDGQTVVVLETGAKVEEVKNAQFTPGDTQGLITTLTSTEPPPGTPSQPETPQWTAPAPPEPLPPAGLPGTPPGEPLPPEPPTTPPDDGFVVQVGGDVITKTCSDVLIKVLGSQFGYSDGTLVDIVVAAGIGTSTMTPLFNNQPVHGGETFNQTSVPAGTQVTLKGEVAGSYERWLWTKYGYPLSYTSNDGMGQVVVLSNGDAPINNNPAYPCQVGVGSLLAPYVKSGKILIADNQALYCFDFNPLRTHTGIDYNDLVVLATATAAARPCEDEPTSSTTAVPPVQAGCAIAGLLNINPNNSSDFEFELYKPGGSKIIRDNLLFTTPKIDYTGPATLIRVRPKGYGNQNSITLDGKAFSVKNGTVYVITLAPGATDASLNVHLYNTKVSGASMGKWWIAVTGVHCDIKASK